MPNPFSRYENCYSNTTDRERARQTDERTYTFFKAPRHTDSNGIQHYVVASIKTDRQQNNKPPQ